MAKYLYTSRPPGIGCQPDGFTDREVWMPGREVDGRHYLGVAEYDGRLKFEDIAAYELMPEDKEERIVYSAWKQQLGWWIMDDYLCCGEEHIDGLVNTDPVAYLVSQIRELLLDRQWFVMNWLEEVLADF